MKNRLKIFAFCGIGGIGWFGMVWPIDVHAAESTVEVIQGRPRSSGRSGKVSSKPSTRLDQDKNGSLSLDELQLEHQRQIQAFHLADKNQDGQLSAAEKKFFIKSVKLKR
jgi:EF hand